MIVVKRHIKMEELKCYFLILFHFIYLFVYLLLIIILFLKTYLIQSRYKSKNKFCDQSGTGIICMLQDRPI